MNSPQDASQTMTARKEIAEVGFATLKEFFTLEELKNFESVVVDLFLLQAKKIGEYRNKAIDLENSNQSNFEKFSAIYEMMELDDKEALYQVQKYLTSSSAARALFNERFNHLTTSLLGSNRNCALTDGPALFINRPNTERLLYKWHSEAHYYPKRRRLLNIWLPLFDNKSKSNGTMSFKERSHLRDFPFSDYQGYNRDTQNKSNYFVQYEIPSNLLGGYKEHWCEVAPRDLIIFHRNLVHTSNQNTSSKYSVAAVARVWDPTDDLTISGSIGATPYGGNIGRANLVVDSLD
jgi:ectoine hydroxylase-related dioxygenase (phytanoyl-CoA dioxygenase family)